MPKSSPHPQNDPREKRELITLEHPLELPDGSGFESRSVRVGLDAMIQLCEERLHLFNARPGAEAERLRDKCDVEFIL